MTRTTMRKKSAFMVNFSSFSETSTSGLHLVAVMVSSPAHGMSERANSLSMRLRTISSDEKIICHPSSPVAGLVSGRLSLR